MVLSLEVLERTTKKVFWQVIEIVLNVSYNSGQTTKFSRDVHNSDTIDMQDWIHYQMRYKYVFVQKFLKCRVSYVLNSQPTKCCKIIFC